MRNAGPKPFELHPSAMYPNDELPVRMSGSRVTKRIAPISPYASTAESVAITVADDGAIWFTAPEHEDGLVDVTVRSRISS